MSFGKKDEQTDRSLCSSCNHAHILRGFAESEEQVWCTYGWDTPMRPVPFRVRTCTDYSDVRKAGLSEMEDIALLLTEGSRGKKAGFLKTVEVKDDE